MVTIERKDGVFTARIGTLVLHSGKSAKAIARCYDIKDAMEKRLGVLEPFVVGTTTFPASVELPGKMRREFFVTVEGLPLCASSNANRVYEFCDELNRLTGLVPNYKPEDLVSEEALLGGDFRPSDDVEGSSGDEDEEQQ